MSRGEAAHLSKRRSALRRCPSGEAQYCAGVSHPTTPACFLFVMCKRSSSRVFEHHRYARLFSFPDGTNAQLRRSRLNVHGDTVKTDPARGSGHRVGAERNPAAQNAP